MLESLGSWVGGKRPPGGEAKSDRLPILEQLEPRLLLSADSLCTQPLLSLDMSRSEQADLIDEVLSHSEQPETAQSAILTLELAPLADTATPVQNDDTHGEAVASVQVGSDEASSDDQIGLVADSGLVEADAAVNSSLPQSLAGSPEYNVETVLPASAASTQTEPTGPAAADRQTDAMLKPESQTIEIRGPPADDPCSTSKSGILVQSRTAGGHVRRNSLRTALEWTPCEGPGCIWACTVSGRRVGQGRVTPLCDGRT